MPLQLQTCSAPTGFVSDSTDCDDSTASVYVGAPELCDGIDNNCNSILDDGLSVQDYWLDSDGDTWGTPIVLLSRLVRHLLE